jgi:hypothetical protein
MAAIFEFLKNFSAIPSHLEYFSFKQFFARLRHCRDTEKPEMVAILNLWTTFLGHFPSFETHFI